MSDSDWYLVDRAGRRYGPYDREMVESLVHRQELRADTPVWHPGLAAWRAAGTLFAGLEQHADAPRRPAPAEPSAAKPVAARSARSTSPQAKARAPVVTPARGPAVAVATAALWQRTLAAAFDALLVAITLQLVVHLTAAPRWLGTPRAALVAWAAVEGWLLANSGRTPGKALFAVRVHRQDGSRLDQRTALQRSAALPFVLLLLPLGPLTLLLGGAVLVFTAARLRAGRPAWWDELSGTAVSVDPLPPARWALAALACGVLLLILLLASAEYS